MGKFFTICIFATLCLLAMPAFAAVDTVWVDDNGTPGYINTVIQGDTSLTTGERINPDRVYMLHRGGFYALNGSLLTKAHTHIRIYGEDAPTDGSTDLGMPVLIEGTETGVYYYYNIESYGDITMKNVWIMYVTDAALQNWTSMQFDADSTHGYFENCIFDWATAICVTTGAKEMNFYFKNCIFRNCIDAGQYWAGRQICTVATDATIDTCISTNCSFENMGFVFQTDYIPPKYCYYDHNTFLNIAKFSFKFYYFTHLIATNNIFFNNHFTGERYFDRVGQDPDKLLWGQVLDCDTIPEGTTYNNCSESQRVCVFSNNATYTQSDFQTYYDTYNAIDSVQNSGNGVRALLLAEPVYNDRTLDMFTWHSNFVMSNNYDMDNDGETANPGFVTPATQMDSIMAFLQARYVSGGTVFWGYKSSLAASWPLPENLSYTNSTLLTAGTNGYPLGDLYHWFPTQYASWAATAVEKSSSTVPGSFSLSQNYPNPFNPTTQIEYNVAKNAFVSLKVYNVLGQEVATLQNGLQAPGSYKATFNAKNLATGMYIYTLKAGELSFSKKMMLIK